MKFDAERWDVVDNSIKSESSLTDDKYRRTVGYVEDAIYKPTITDQIVIAWSDYIQVYLTEYKVRSETYYNKINKFFLVINWLVTKNFIFFTDIHHFTSWFTWSSWDSYLAMETYLSQAGLHNYIYLVIYL